MQTGYDNFWMYQNNGHNPVSNSAKNDNYIYPGLTDNYKQRQSGGCPSKTFVLPFNNVAKPQNNHYSTGTHCMWPSSVYSLPLNSSYSNNYHSQVFPTQTNNFNCSSQYSQLKNCMRNYNVNISLKSRSINDKQVTNRLPQVSDYTETENARIRVKDVFALNSNAIYSETLDNNLAQSQKSKQYEYPLNYNPNYSNRTCDFEANVPLPKHLSPSYIQTEQPHLNNQQQFLQCSGRSCQQNGQISSGGQIQSNGSHQRESNSQSEELKKSLLAHLLRNTKNDEEIRDNFYNSLNSNKTATLKPKGTNHLNCFGTVNSHDSAERSNNVNNHDSSQVNKNSAYDRSCSNGFAFVQNQNQVSLMNIEQAHSLNQISSLEDSRKRQMSEQIITSKTKGFPDNQISNLGNNLVKITIPHTGQSTYVNAVEPGSNNRNSNLSLPSLLESHNEMYHETLKKNNTQNYIQQNNCDHMHEISPVRRQSCNTSPDRNNAYNMSPRCNPTARNSNCALYNGTGNISENFSSNICDENENSNEFIENSPEAESISNGETVPSDVQVKQEILTSEVDTSSGQLDNDFTVDYELQGIKTEEYSEDFQLQQERESSGNSPLAKEHLPLNSDDSESLEFNKEEKHTVVPKTVPDSKLKASVEDGKYLSKINRDKLDLLIQFLKKEDEVVKAKTSEENHDEVSAKKISDGNTIKKKVSLSCSRRKLSKTLLVKNKNNSREMVSLMSTKTFRGEGQNSPKTPETPERDENLTKEDDRKTNCSDEVRTNEKRVGFPEKEVKYFNPPQDNEKQNKCDFQSGSKIENVSLTKQIRESGIDEEKNIVHIMQAFKNLKSHFCLSCTLVSPIESFWINVVSGELRCLNCFKKMTLKADENMKHKRACCDDGNTADVTYFLDSNAQRRNESKKENNLEMFLNKCKCERSSENSQIEPKVDVKQETVNPESEAAKDKIVYTGNEEQSFSFKCKNSEVKDAVRTSDVPRKKSVDEQTKIKLEESDKNQNSEEKGSPIKLRKKSNSVENQIIVNTSTVSSLKQLSDLVGKKYASGEENDSQNPKGCCDNLKKGKKPFVQSIGKPTPKEYKTLLSKEGLEQEMKGNTEKSLKKNLFKEEEFSENDKKDKKQFRGSNHGRKRANSKEEQGSHKIRISEDEVIEGFSRGDHTSEGVLKKNANESLDKSMATNFLKESTTDQRAKVPKQTKSKSGNLLDDSERKMSAFKNLEKEKSTHSSDQVKKRRTSAEELIPRKIRAVEKRSKLSKQFYEKAKTISKADESVKNKTSEHSKHFTADLTSASRRKSKDEWLLSKEQSKSGIKNSTESFEKSRRNSTSKKNFSSPEQKKEIKSESFISENKEKKYLSRNRQASHKSSEKSNFEANNSPSSDDKHQKTDAASKPLKESQRTESELKISSPTHTLKKEEFHGNRQKRNEKMTEMKKNEMKTGGDAAVEDKIERKKCDKSQGFRQSKKDKALECIFGRKKENQILNGSRKVYNENPPSTKLLEKLIEKTKKLSETLLNKS